MTGFRFDMAHTVFIGIFSAFEEGFLCQMRNGENVNILVAVCLPKLGGLYENIFFGMDMEKTGGSELTGFFVVTNYVKVYRIAFTKLVNGFKTGHLAVPPIKAAVVNKQ